MLIRGARLADATDARTAARVDAVRLNAGTPGPAALADALTALPGVSSFDDQGTRAQPTLDIRGFSLSPVVGVPQGVSVFLDGVRINEADAQQVNFDLLPMDAIARAEFVRGPQPIFGKNSLAGALLLTTRRGDGTRRIEASTEAGAFGYRAGYVAVSGAGRGLDGFVMLRASDESGWRVDTPARTRLLFASGGRRRERDDLALTLLAGHNRIYQAGSLPESWLETDRRANFTAGDFYEPTLLHVALRGERTFNARGHVRGNVFVRRNDTERFNVNAGAPSVRSRTAAHSVGGTIEASLPVGLLGTGGGVVVGLEGARNAVGYRVYQEPSGDAEPEEECDPGSYLCERATANEVDAAAYAQAVLGLPADLAVEASVRGDWVRVPFRDLRDPDNSATHVFRRVSPRIGVTWEPSARGRLFATFGTGFRAPAALELACADEAAPCNLPFALGDDPPLAPVRVRDAEIGGELRAVRGVRLSASAWRTTARDEIFFVASRTTAGFFRNVARTSRDGLELSARTALPRGARASASYAWLDARWRSTARLASANPDAEPVRSGDPMPLSPAHRATAAIGLTALRAGWLFDADISGRAVSRQWLRGDEAATMPPLPGYATVQLRSSVQRGRIALAITIANLTGTRASSFGIYGVNSLGSPGASPPATPVVERFLTPLAPRALTVSLTLRP